MLSFILVLTEKNGGPKGMFFIFLVAMVMTDVICICVYMQMKS